LTSVLTSVLTSPPAIAGDEEGLFGAAQPAPGEEVVLGRAFRTYTEGERRRFFETILRLRYGPFDPAAGERKQTWAQIAETLKVSRTTVQAWRDSEEFKALERRYRQSLKDEARTDLATMQEDALSHLQYLMRNARSEQVQFWSAQALIQHGNLAAEEAERKTEAEGELVRLQAALLKSKARQELMAAHGASVASVREARVRPGGLLPEVVVRQNAIVKALAAGQDPASIEIEVEAHEVSPEAEPEEDGDT
jgi:hypothetical protein